MPVHLTTITDGPADIAAAVDAPDSLSLTVGKLYTQQPAYVEGL